MHESAATKDAVVGARRLGEMKRDTLYRSTVDVSETFIPVKGPSRWVLDQQEIPALHLHDVSPGNVVCFASTRTEASIDM
jgi:hypothetical protein